MSPDHRHTIRCSRRGVRTCHMIIDMLYVAVGPGVRICHMIIDILYVAVDGRGLEHAT